MSVRVLLAEDHNLVRQGAKLYLESRGVTIVGEAANGRDAVAMARDLQPDIVVMDIRMPELTGIEATRRIRHDCPDVRVLILSAYDEPQYVSALLDAGADGFVLKHAELPDLYAAIQDIATGRQAFDRAMLQKARQYDADAPGEALTAREVEVLSHAATGQSNKEIGARLYISDRTVQGHLQNIYQKLGVATRTEAVTLAIQRGLIAIDSEG